MVVVVVVVGGGLVVVVVGFSSHSPTVGASVPDIETQDLSGLSSR